MTLSVIVPVYNEEETVLQSVKRLLKVKDVKQVVVINDGSTDQSRQQLQKLEDDRVTLFHTKNAGKGAAIRKALPYLSQEYTLIHDADLEYNPQDIEQLLKPVRQGRAKVVYGTRFLGAAHGMSWVQKKANGFLNWMLNLLFDTKLTDLETCYKLIPTETLKEMKLYGNSFTIEQELTSKLLKKGFEIKEVPIHYEARGYEQGKKISWRDGLKAVWIILRERFLVSKTT